MKHSVERSSGTVEFEIQRPMAWPLGQIGHDRSDEFGWGVSLVKIWHATRLVFAVFCLGKSSSAVVKQLEEVEGHFVGGVSCSQLWYDESNRSKETK